MKMKKLALAIGFMAVGINCQAAVIVSNLSETTNGAQGVGTALFDPIWASNGFTVGSNAAGYDLNSVTVSMADKVGSPSNFTLSIYSDDGGEPDALLETLVGDNNPATAGLYSYTSTGLALSANTSYFLLAKTDDVAGLSDIFEWETTSSQNQTSPDGWLIGDNGVLSTDLGNSWFTEPDNKQMFSIDATPSAVPVPAAVWLFGSGLIGLAGVAKRKKA